MQKRLIKFSLIISMSVAAACAPTADFTDTLSSPPTVEGFEASKAWDEFESYFNLFYAYSDKMDFDVDVALQAIKKQALKTTSKSAFRQEIVKFGHLFADPHIIIGPLRDSDFNVVPTSSDMRVRFKDGKYSIEDVRAGSAADKAKIRPGFTLLSVDQTLIDTAVSDMFLGLVEVPTPRQKSHAATLIANGTRVGSRELLFAGEQAVTLENPRVFAEALSQQSNLSISYDDDIAVIRIHNALGNNETIKAFDGAMRETANAKGLILDLRETPSGGNAEVGRSIIGHFVSEERPYQIHTVPSLEREFTVPRKFTEYVFPRQPYRAPAETVVLGSYWTGSMGEGIIIGLNGAANMHVIASDMGDLLGGLSNYNLNLSDIRLDLPSETLSHIDGTPRSEFVANTSLISADRDAFGGDAAMDAALAHLRLVQKTP